VPANWQSAGNGHHPLTGKKATTQPILSINSNRESTEMGITILDIFPDVLISMGFNVPLIRKIEWCKHFKMVLKKEKSQSANINITKISIFSLYWADVSLHKQSFQCPSYQNAHLTKCCIN
jgi:hypothetical protein